MLDAATTHPDVQAFVAGGAAEQLPAHELVGYLVETFGVDLALACSFQKEESVLLDMLLAADPSSIQSVSGRLTVPSWRCRTAPKDLKIAP